MSFGFHLREDFGDLSFGIDEKGSAFDAHILLAVHTFFDPHAEGFGGEVIRVGEQGVRQAVLGLELGLLGGRIGRDAEDDGFGLIERGDVLAKLASLLGSAGRVGFGIEEEDDLLAVKRGELNQLAGFGGEREFGGRSAGREHT